MNIYNLVLEVTRKCNLNCDHCLRGEPENKVMSDKVIDDCLKLFENGYISELTLSGGEPFLVPNVIKKISNTILKYNITIGMLFISTNASMSPVKLTKSLSALIPIAKNFEYDDDNIFCIRISNTYYHEMEKYSNNLENNYHVNTKILKSLFGEKITFSEKNNDIRDDKYFLKEGRFSSNICAREQDYLNYIRLVDDTIDSEMVYITTDGRIVLDCNMSYETMLKYDKGYCGDLIKICDKEINNE